MLRAQRDLERHVLPSPQDSEQQRAPGQEESRSAYDRHPYDRSIVEQRQLAQREQADHERGVQ
jgi:hypothetical protein